MNKIYLILIVFCLAFVGCKDDNPGKEQVQTNKLTKTWYIGSEGHVLVNGQDITYDYENFTIRFASNGSDKVYYVTNGYLAFPAAIDTWSFADQNYESIIRGVDGIEMQTEFVDNTLTLRFSIPEPNNAKMQGGFGDFEFYLTEYK
ncbi:hypothetical protein [Marinigracilibium pacificum]|uniref:Lipocalin-like domain-containing protein n=1 Tax=Marinigracilibium pacificum TaxID=2729599 RepID=A0A848IYG9_9BACT|nr:hypothetical protein [Marinigracilibium pacificum]NMM47340.1 hypothetical protein [Marinigracilibium pacificum]